MLEVSGYPEPVIELRNLLNTYLDPDKVALILKAYEVGAEAHHGQTRKTGEAYIFHPVAVAGILAEMRMDYESIAAAILHDTIEDTPLTKAQIEDDFSQEIADLVDGVTKLDKMKFRTRHEATAESFRKLMLAMARDLRVIFIKLADRLHNLRTLGAMAPDSRRRIARETLDIYAPMANRLGMHDIKTELEDLGFANLFPWRHEVISERLESMTSHRQNVIDSISLALKKKMSEAGIPCQIQGREKTPYSIYKKMIGKGLSFSEVTDVYAFRIVTYSEPHCYLALGVAHSLYQPRPGMFKDYVALPKANGYQSLHTILNTPYGLPIEIQVRTEEMDLLSEKGAAAHWAYKASDGDHSSAQVRAREWLMQLVDVQRHTSDSTEFLEGAKSDLFPDEIFVFTPKGKIIDLRRNATALDFAYAIHTDVGNHTQQAIVDNVNVPLSTRLNHGQTVKIITHPEVNPKPEWLEFVATARARTAIRHYLKSLDKGYTVKLGMMLLEKALNAQGARLQDVPAETISQYLKDNHFKSQEDMLRELAVGNLLANVVAGKFKAEATGDVDAHTGEAIYIAGTEGNAISFGNCCHPVPGDGIMGYLSAGKGVVVHRISCRNVPGFRKAPERCLDVAWAPIVTGTFPVVLRVTTKNERGVLASLSASIGQAHSNIERVEHPDINPEAAVLEFTVGVSDRNHMARVMRRLRRNKHVIKVSRVRS